MNTWHVIHGGGPILAVYGGALHDMAHDKAQAIEKEVGLPATIVTIQCTTRPKVGDPFPVPDSRIL
jgi:hypothetical protein